MYDFVRLTKSCRLNRPLARVTFLFALNAPKSPVLIVDESENIYNFTLKKSLLHLNYAFKYSPRSVIPSQQTLNNALTDLAFYAHT